jgi:hypothetical protein
MFERNRLSSLMAFLLCAFLPTQSTLAQTDAVFSLYENPSLGIRIQYPYDWEWKHRYDEVHFSLPQEDAGFQLVVEVIPTLNRSLDEMVTFDTGLSNFSFIESPKKITLGKYPALMMVYNFTSDGIDVKSMQILILWEYRTYSILYVAEPTKYNDYLPTIKKMINSFEIMVQDNLPTKPDFLTYHNSTYGLAIQYPSSWIKDERGDGSDDCHDRVVEFSDPSGTDAQLNIYVQYHGDDLYEGDTQKEVLESELEFYRDYQNPDFYDDFKVTESNINSTLAGYPAYKLEFSNKAGVTEYNSVQTGIVIDLDAYFIIADVKAENYSANFPTIQKMIDSFKMEEPKDFVCLASGKPPVPAEDTNKTSTESKPGTDYNNKTSTELKPGTM